VTEADLRQLAAQRAQAVRDYILATGQAGADRLFIVASSAASEEAKKAQGKASRVDFSLR
jgi:phage protein U